MYLVRDDPPKDVQESLKDFDAISQRLLFTRGITDKESADAFFDTAWRETDPYQYQSMYRAAERVLQAVRDNEVIGIYSDYDCDGIPAAAALFSTLSALNHSKIVYEVPDRNIQGFGVHAENTQRMLEKGVSVVCVLDCGTAHPDEIARIQESGTDVIILDHHLPGERTPEAFALINPTIEESVAEPYPCAAGVVFLFIQALVKQAQQILPSTKLPLGWERWQLDIIGLATISDMVPIRGINRQFVRYGLAVFQKSPRPGIRALCSLLKIKQERVTQDDLTYLVIPRINAASRMGDANLAFDLLTATSFEKAAEITNALTTLNNRRKSTVAAMVREAEKTAQHKNKESDVWVFGSRSWKPSLAGLVAQKLAEKYGKTVFVWGQCTDTDKSKQQVKGSCRSADRDIFTLMQQASHLFTESGGHKQAGGFTLTDGAEVCLEDELNQVPSPSTDENQDEQQVDLICNLRDIPDILAVSDSFAPFGMQNEHIRIALNTCRIKSIHQFGKQKDHVRYTLTDGNSNLQGIKFFAGDVSNQKTGVPCQIIGSVERDVFSNRPRIRVTDIFSSHE
ncbi:MAG: DHH family phosphoesterase [Candidatus Kaiserbacteria bacterium]|nr:DHH family phosphoesterase [Candidatus Kaiserbacteria bacterium]